MLCICDLAFWVAMESWAASASFCWCSLEFRCSVFFGWELLECFSVLLFSVAVLYRVVLPSCQSWLAQLQCLWKVVLLRSVFCCCAKVSLAALQSCVEFCLLLLLPRWAVRESSVVRVVLKPFSAGSVFSVFSFLFLLLVGVLCVVLQIGSNSKCFSEAKFWVAE